MNTIIIVIFVLVLGFLFYIFYKEIKKQKRKKIVNVNAKKVNLTSDMGLNKKLLKMLNGDENAALRLIRNVRLKNPGKSYGWYQEKVIRDLERDRR